MQLQAILDQLYAIGRGAVIRSPYWDGSNNFFNIASHIGNTEGAMNLEPNEEYSQLKLPENTGPGILEEYETGAAPTFELGIFPSPDTLAIFSSTGSPSGGNRRQRKTKKHTLWIVPEQLFIKSNPTTGVDEEVEVTLSGGNWTKDGQPFTADDQALFDMSIFLWKARFGRSMPVYRHEDAGKSLRTVAVQVLVDTGKPDGHMLWTMGSDLADSDIDLEGSYSS